MLKNENSMLKSEEKELKSELQSLLDQLRISELNSTDTSVQ